MSDAHEDVMGIGHVVTDLHDRFTDIGHIMSDVDESVIAIGHVMSGAQDEVMPMPEGFENPGDLGALLRAARIAAGLEVGQLAKKLKQSARTVSRWELGYTRPHPSKHAPLFAALGAAPFAQRAAIARRLGLVVPSKDPAGTSTEAIAPSPPKPDMQAIRAWLDAVLFAQAEDLDVSPGGLRVAFDALLAELERLDATPRDARAALSSKTSKKKR
jgi:hypothetical protein